LNFSTNVFPNDLEVNMNHKATSILILSLSIATAAFSQGRGPTVSSGRAGGPPSGIGASSGQRGPGEHGSVNAQENRGPRTESATERSARNEMSAKLTENPQLASRLQTMLGGANLETAADGFKNFGQFVAAVHVSKNLEISFDQLKTEMITNKQSLAQAVQTVKPELTESAANEEAKKAETQASQDLKK
jgi:hypothetical protein